MGLIGNYTLSGKSPARRLTGTGAGLRDTFNTPGRSRGMFVGSGGIPELAAVPRGYRPGQGAWIVPYQSGDMSSVNEADFSMVTNTPYLIAGRNIDGTTTITFTNPAVDLQLIVSATGSATLSWSGTGSLAGALAASGTASFQIDTNNPLLGAVADLTAGATITLTGSAAATALGNLAGDILPYTELSPESLANAVWGRIVESGFTAEEILRILAAVAAGNASGLNSSPSFTGLDGSTTRVAGTLSGESRSVSTVDGA